jgi:hypothetical protein
LPLDLLSLVLSELIARANTLIRSILGRKIGTWARQYTTAATATAQPQSQNATQRDQTYKERRPRVAPKGTKHQPELRPGAARRPARTPCGPPTRAVPPHRHGRRRMAAARPAAAVQERRRAPDATLWRQLPHEPYPSPTPPCAHAPSGRHSQASAEPADGAQLPPPPPPARGATAPSSPPFPSHFTSHCWSIEAQSQSRRGDRTGENIERGSFDRTGDSG